MYGLVKPKWVDPDAKPPALAGPLGVVVPAYNAADTIAACLASLQNQRDVTIDLVVVDDGPTDGTAAVAQAAGARVVRLAANGGAGGARNEGAKRVGGDVVFFAEADGCYAPDFLRTCLRALADPEVGASIALGVRAWTDRDNAVTRWGDAVWIAAHSLVALGRRGTGAWCYRREAFAAAGGFDETLRHGEDLDLARRIGRRGYRTGVAGWATIRHRNPDTWRAWAREAWRKARARGLDEKPTAAAWLAQGLKAGLLAAIPAAFVAGALVRPLWLPVVLAALIALCTDRAENRLALRWLWIRRDWRTAPAVPSLCWLRRFCLAGGRLAGWVRAEKSGRKSTGGTLY